MRKKSPPQYRSAVAMAMAFVMLLASLPVNLAQAAMVTTDQVIEDSTAAEARAQITEFMARADVRQELRSLGIDPEEAARRAAALSDQEIQRIAGRLEKLPAGQGAAALLIEALLVVFLVLLLTDLLGFTDIYPFLKPRR